MKKMLLIPFMLSGCLGNNPNTVPDVIQHTKSVVFIPDDRFFVCPEVQLGVPIPDMTQKDIAKLIASLDSSNKICRKSLEAVKKQLLDAKRRIR